MKCAVAGNDPNVGRIVGAIGSYLGTLEKGDIADGGGGSWDLTKGLQVSLGGVAIFSEGAFRLDEATEQHLSDYMLNCQLFPDSLPEHDRNYPPHNRCVEIGIALQSCDTDPSSTASSSSATSVVSPTVVVFGSDLTKEYVAVNADYRS